MSRADHSKQIQDKFEKFQNKCDEFAEEMQKFRDEFTIDKHMHMQEEDNAISSFQHKVEMMADTFRRMKHNCF
jgi:uncharacterized membrane protein (DUF106 family)